MLSDVDHGLTKLGVTQCAELQRQCCPAAEELKQNGPF